MKKFGLLISLFLTATLTHADTKGFFGNSEFTTVIVQGRPGDTDAVSIFNSMLAVQKDEAGFIKKEVTFTTSASIKVLDIVCKISKSIQNFGSCTLVIYQSPWTSMGSSSVLLALDRGIDSNEVAKNFVAADESGKIVGSSNGKLSIRFDRDNSTFGLFSIVYRE